MQINVQIFAHLIKERALGTRVLEDRGMYFGRQI